MLYAIAVDGVTGKIFISAKCLKLTVKLPM